MEVGGDVRRRMEREGEVRRTMVVGGDVRRRMEGREEWGNKEKYGMGRGG
jgi:hypothetical protein